MKTWEAAFRERLSVYPWWELADELTAEIDATARLCRTFTLPLVEIKALWLSHCIVFQLILERADEWISQRRPMEAQEINSRRADSPQAKQELFNDLVKQRHLPELCKLRAAMEAFAKEFQNRGNDSAQTKYAEARLSSRRSLMEKHNPLLDGFPELVEILREVCSQETFEYMTGDVRLKFDRYLDMLHMLAHDRADPATVANPPARIHVALKRKQHRNEELDRERSMELTAKEANRKDPRQDPKHIESSVIANVDWERGKAAVQLPPDQARAVEAKMEGVNLQSSDAADDLGLEPAQLENIRRSLGPDRRWGKQLRERFSAYAPKKGPGN